MNTFITFENRVCLVTGAGSENGIGFSTAKYSESLAQRYTSCQPRSVYSKEKRS